MTATDERPWYQRTYRWGQTNLTEVDPVRYDADWWRDYWRRTQIQGVIVNAGGIVAYYPSAFPLHHRAEFLGERDFFGEIAAAAREDGLVVVARMDSNRADEAFFLEHPDWFAVDASGRPYRAGDRYIACINSPYYEEYLTEILREIIDRYHPEGFADNSWSGLDRSHICYCPYCARNFRDATGHTLPRAHDWDDQAYREWILWSYERRIAVWDLNNRVTRQAGGADCLWVGMNSGDVIAQSQRFRDYPAICERAEIIFLDYQARHHTAEFQSNAQAGMLIHGLLGWDKLIPESMAMYGAGQPTFRVGSKPAPEARLWVVEGFASGLQPWWHHIGAYHEDRRQYQTAPPLFAWHAAHEEYLIDRQPVANVGVVWSRRSVDFHGRDAAVERAGLPQQGVINALIRARIPYLPVHIDQISQGSEQFQTLILPNVGAMSDEQCRAVRAFVAAGGSLIASGETSLYDEWGDRRTDFALADLFGAHASGVHHGSLGDVDPSWETWANHTYLRLAPELRAQVDGPQVGSEPAVDTDRHPVLDGFEQTDLLPFAGRLEVVRAESDTVVPLTYVPPFPIFPPETSWMRHPSTNLPALVLKETSGRGRVAYLAADLDRDYARDRHPDHARLLANLVRWTTGASIPLCVDGRGLVDCHLFRQPGRLLLHLVNLTGVGNAPVAEFTEIGPLTISVCLPEDVAGREATLLVAGDHLPVTRDDGRACFTLPDVVDHEVVVIT